METIINAVEPFFARYKWRFNKSSNTICFKNKNPYDEFIIKMIPQTHEICVIVPVDSVPYKQTFKKLATAIDYITMHLEYYQGKN